MLSFISIIKYNGITATYRIEENHQNQYKAELMTRSTGTENMPQQISLNKYKLVQSASDSSNLVISKIASAILLAENIRKVSPDFESALSFY